MATEVLPGENGGDERLNFEHMDINMEDEVPQNITVGFIQGLLKEKPDFEDTILQAGEELSSVKSEIVLTIKKHFVLEQETERLENQIRLLIRNHLLAENFRKQFNSSVLKIKNLNRVHNKNKTEISDDKFKIYGHLLFLLRKEPRYLGSLIRLVRFNEVDTILKTVVFTLFGDQYEEKEENLLLSLFEVVLIKEFDNVSQIGEFMRSNTAFTKILSAVFKRSIYTQFLKKVLTPALQQVTQDFDLNFEVNPNKVYQELVKKNPNLPKASEITEEEIANNPEVQAIIKPRMIALQESVQLFLDRILESVNETPYGLRYVCKKIHQYGKLKYPDAKFYEINSLVGGFIFLRFFNPAITAPEGKNLLEYKLDSIQRNNLTRVGKILQNLSNAIKFGVKEKFMIPFNSFIEQYYERIAKYFEALIDVDELTDRLELDEYLEYTSDEKSIHISINEVYLMHRICVTHLDTLASSEDDSLRQIVGLLNTYGPPPEQLPDKDDYYFNLGITNKFRNEAVDDEFDFEQLYSELRQKVAFALSKLPIIPDSQEVSITILQVFKAAQSHYTEEADTNFANFIAEIVQEIQVLENENLAQCDDENNTTFLQHIYNDIKHREKRYAMLSTKLQKLKTALSELVSHTEYLEGQIEAYKTYLGNARKKTFNPVQNKANTRRSTIAHPIVGPFNFKFTELVKLGVIVDSPFPKAIRKQVSVVLSSLCPGVFNFVVTVKGYRSFKIEVDLNDLLMMQSNNQQEFKYSDVTLNVTLLIHLLNKLFVVKPNVN